MEDFQVGDNVEIMMKDRKRFSGVLLWFNDDYFVLTPGLGFPHEDVVFMSKLS